MKDHEAELYVGIDGSSELRRPILEAAKFAITSGRSQDKLLQIQDQKLAVRTDLALVIKDFREELAKLRMILPHREVKEVAVHMPKRKEIDHRVDKIAAALAEIEQRMKSL